MYKAGIKTTYDSSEKRSITTKSEAIPLYIGFTPVHYLNDYSQVVNKAILIHDNEEAIDKLGYCDDWEHYTLCPAIHAHFMGDDNIGPVLFLNVFNPDTIKKSSEEQVAVTFNNGEAIIENATNIITNTVKIDGKTQGDDFVVMRSTDGATIRVVSTNKGNLTNQQTIKYFQIDTSRLDKTLIKGARVQGGDSTGVWAADSAYFEYNIKPNIVCVPKFSRETDVREEVSKILHIYGEKYDLYAYYDAPCSSTGNTDTLEGIKQWEKTTGHNTTDSTLNWGTYVVGGKKYPVSVVRTKVAQILDNTTLIPSKVPSNYILGTGKLISDEGKEIKLKTSDGIELDSIGISTIIYAEGAMRTWGTKTSRYRAVESDSLDPRDIEEIRMRSIYAVANKFKSDFFNELHKPLTVSLKNNIINTFQAFLNQLTTRNELLYAKIDFDDYGNSLDTLIKGEFYFKTLVTSGGNLNYIDLRLKWTDKGFEKFFIPSQEGGTS